MTVADETLCKECVRSIYDLELDKRRLVAEQQELRAFSKEVCCLGRLFGLFLLASKYLRSDRQRGVQYGRLSDFAAVAHAIQALEDQPVFLAKHAWRKFEKLTPGSKRSPCFNRDARCTHGRRLAQYYKLAPSELARLTASCFAGNRVLDGDLLRVVPQACRF